MKDCIFCKIVKGEIDSEKVHETENVFCFLDANPRSMGHTLVIPKKHFNGLSDLDEDLIAELFTVVKKVEEILESSINPDAFTIGINEGKEAGQEIPHLHVNIIPRFKDDGGKSIHAVVKNPPEEDISEIGKRIRETSNQSET